MSFDSFGNALGAAVGAALGWLANSALKLGKNEFKEFIQRHEAKEEALIRRIVELEKALADRITRDEFERGWKRLEDSIKEFRAEFRAEMKDMKTAKN